MNTLTFEQIQQLLAASVDGAPVRAIREELRVTHEYVHELLESVPDDSGNPETLAIIEEETIVIRVSRIRSHW